MSQTNETCLTMLPKRFLRTAPKSSAERVFILFFTNVLVPPINLTISLKPAIRVPW